MRRRVAEQSQVMTIDDRIDEASESLRDGDIGIRRQAIRDLDALSRLPEADRRHIVAALSEFIEVQSPQQHEREQVSPAVQAALSLAGTLPGHGFKLDRATLRKANLAHLDFSGARLSNVVLRSVDATGVNLSNALFARVSLIGSVLDGARLDGADLQFTALDDVSLVGVSTTGLRMRAGKVINVAMRDETGRPYLIFNGTVDEESATADSAADGDSAPPRVGPSEAPGQGDAEIEGLLDRARGLLYRDDLRGAADAYDEAILLSLEHENRFLEAVGLLEISEVNVELTHFDAAIQNINNALPLFRQLGDRQSEGRAEVALAKVMARTGVPDGAEEHYLRALDLFAEVGDTKSRADVLSNLADVMVELGRYSEAADYAERGARNLLEIRDRAAEMSLLKRMAETIEAAGQHAISLSLYEKALTASADLLGGGHPDTVALVETVNRLSQSSEAARMPFDDWSIGAVGLVLGSSGRRYGVCFQVGPRLWVTAGKAVETLRSDSSTSVIRLSPALGGGWLNATVEHEDPVRNLVVLRADEDPAGRRPPLPGMPAFLSEFCSADAMRPGEEVGVICAGEQGDFAFLTGEWAEPGPVRGMISVRVVAPEGLWSGQAGTPIVRVRDGAVAGMVTAIGRSASSPYWTVWGPPADDIVAALDGIADVTMATDSGDETAG
jgi:uncharacterized protein YjbI with pentapeptide repeats